MTRVDPGDDTIERWVAFHFRYDPDRKERRNVILAAFDDSGEFRDFLDATARELDVAKARGEAEQVEHLGGWCRPPGYLAAQAATRLYPKAPKGPRVRKHT